MLDEGVCGTLKRLQFFNNKKERKKVKPNKKAEKKNNKKKTKKQKKEKQKKMKKKKKKKKNEGPAPLGPKPSSFFFCCFVSFPFFASNRPKTLFFP